MTFTVYNALGYANQPALAGTIPLPVLSDATVTTLNGPCYIDYEPDTSTAAALETAIGTALYKLQSYRDQNPTLKIGFYGLTPWNNFWDILNPPGNPTLPSQNALTKPLADQVDFLFPSLYAPYEYNANAPSWQNDAAAKWWWYATQTIAMARTIAPGKPLCPFMYPQYLQNPATVVTAPWDYIDPVTWGFMLQMVRNSCDGVVLWGGWAGNTQETWDSSAEWWIITQQVLNL